MQSTPRRRFAAAVVGAAAVTMGVGTGSAALAHPSDTGGSVVVTVTQAHGQLTVSPGTSLQAGRITFNYTVPKGDHTLQAAVLHPGYSSAQFGKDVGAGLDKGDLKAIRRLDSKVAWLGGAESLDGATGSFSTTLPAGTVYLFDQDTNARIQLTVTSPAADGSAEQTVATVRVTKHLHWNTPATIPAEGWINLRNNSTEPHVFVAQRVKESTTGKKVRAFIKKGVDQNPSWGLKASADSGIFSPGTTTQLHLDLPAGKYLVLCYWPSKKNGMPHFTMGMWKLIHLT